MGPSSEPSAASDPLDALEEKWRTKPADLVVEERDHAYQLERAGILSSAVGMARLRLRDGDAEGALAVLNEAVLRTTELLNEALRGGGRMTEQKAASERDSGNWILVPNPGWQGPRRDWFCACAESYGNVLRPSSMD